MKLQRFFISPEAVGSGKISLVDKEIINQIKKVLRLKNGDKVIFLDGTGSEYLTEITDLANSSLSGKILESSENKNEPDLKIILCQALCKKDKFEWVLQKGTEVGVSEFIPILAERSEKLGLNSERAGKILKEAAEQSERAMTPKLKDISEFEDALNNFSGEKIILDKSGESIKDYKISSDTKDLALFIGPEGGWTENELMIAKNNGARIISIGPRVLRTETAGLTIAAILLNR